MAKFYTITAFMVCLANLAHAQALLGEFSNVCPDETYTYTVSLGAFCSEVNDITCNGCYKVSKTDNNRSITLKWQSGNVARSVIAKVMCIDHHRDPPGPGVERILSRQATLAPGENPFHVCDDVSITTYTASAKAIPASDRRCSDTNIRLSLWRDDDYPDFLDKGYPFDRSKTADGKGYKIERVSTPAGARPMITLYWAPNWSGRVTVSIEYERRKWDITDIFGKCETDPWQELSSHTFTRGGRPEGILEGAESYVLTGDQEIPVALSYKSSYGGLVKGIKYLLNGSVVSEKRTCSGDLSNLGLSYNIALPGRYDFRTEVLDQCGNWTIGPEKTVNVYPSCYQDSQGSVASTVTGEGITPFPTGLRIAPNTPYTLQVSGITDFFGNYTIDFGNGGNDIIINEDVFSVTKELGKYDINFVKKNGRELCPVIPSIVVFLDGQDMLLEKECPFTLPEDFDEFGFEDVNITDIVLEHFAGHVKSKRAVVVKPGVTLAMGAELILDIEFPNEPPTAVDEQINFIHTNTYDEYNRLLTQSRAYFDEEGRMVQSQLRNFSSGVVLASGSLFDAYNRPAIKTLPAPVSAVVMETDVCEQREIVKEDAKFEFATSFVKDATGGVYDHLDFDRTIQVVKVNNPEPVGAATPGTLGWYYSSNNGTATGDKTAFNEQFIANTSYPFTRSIYNDDGSGELIASTGPGDVIKPGSGKYSQVHSETVSTNDQEVNNYLDFRAKAIGAVSTMGDGKFTKIVSDDANGNRNIVYKDKAGHAIITLYFGKSSSPITRSYEIYDDADRLVANVSPEGVAAFNGANFEDIDKIVYTYNHRGLLTRTKGTDVGEVKYVYRKDGTVRFTQNSKQEPLHAFTYVNYDKFNRVVESGEYTGNITFGSAEMKAIVDQVAQRGGLEGTSGSFAGVVRTYYDLPAEKIETLGGPEAEPLTQTHRVQRFLHSAVACNFKENAVTTWYSYDERGRTEWIVMDVAGLGIKTLDYRYGPVGKMELCIYQRGEADQFVHYYEYDADGRLSKVYTSTQELLFNKKGEVTNPGVLKLQATYEYYLHGPLKRVEYANGIQGIDYVYTADGLIKSINDAVKANDPGKDGNDVFGLTLNYYSGDYTNGDFDATEANHSEDATEWYNGSIKSSLWHSPVDNNATFGYSYMYDNRNQFKSTTWGKLVGTKVNFDLPINSYREEVFEYSGNGNIKHLERTDGAGVLIDQFQYNYKKNSNQLSTISALNDASDHTREYVYDAVGQMITHNDLEKEEELRLEYDHTGKLVNIKAPDGKLVEAFEYDEKGHRIKRTVYAEGEPAKITWTIRDSQGNIVSTYEEDIEEEKPLAQTEVPVYGQSRIGLFKPRFGITEYEVNDHLGNVRAVIGERITAEFLATMETEREMDEDEDFVNIHREVTSSDINKTPPSVTLNAGQHDEQTYPIANPNEVMRMNNKPMGISDPEPVGAGKMVWAHPGDKISAEVFVKYANFDKTRNNRFAGSLGYFVAKAFEATDIIVDGISPFSVLDGAPTGVLTALGKVDERYPKAFLNYLVFDRNMKPILYDQIQVTDKAEIVGAGAHERLSFEFTMEKEGLVYIYLSNLTDLDMDVYFDELRIKHEYSEVVAGGDYYPFGAPIADRQITREKYRFGYQGRNSEYDRERGWNHFQLRDYDPTIARWFNPDPMKQYYSPYLSMGNNPINSIDINGGIDWYYNEDEGLVHKEGVHDKNLKGYKWIAGDDATLNEVYAGMGTDWDFNYVKDQFLYYARIGKNFNNNLNFLSDVAETATGTGLLYTEGVIGATKVGVPSLRALNYFRALHRFGKFNAGIGLLTSSASLYYDYNDYTLPENDPNKISGYRFAWRTVGNFGGIGIGIAVGFSAGGPFGAIAGGTFSGGMWAAEQSYDGVVWYGNEVAKGSVNFNTNGYKWFFR